MITNATPMIVSPKSTCRYGFKCSCCVLHKANARCGKGRDAERRTLKRRERQAFLRDLADA